MIEPAEHFNQTAAKYEAAHPKEKKGACRQILYTWTYQYHGTNKIEYVDQQGIA
jgi:hypothetical protein